MTDETQEHVMWNCYGSVSIKEARERMSSRIREVLGHYGLNDDAVAAALMPWRLEEKGEKKGAACWSGLEEVTLDDPTLWGGIDSGSTGQ